MKVARRHRRRMVGAWDVRSWTRRTRAGAVAALGVAILVALHVTYPFGSFGQLSYLAVLVGAGVIALIGTGLRPARTRVPWVWVALGVCFSGLGDVTYWLYGLWKDVQPDISAADVPWLASYVAISIGLLMLLHRARRSDRSDIDGVIDMAVVGIVSLLVVWQIAIQSTVSDASVPAGVRVVWATYPILDAALLALVVRTAVSRIAGAPLLVAGVACWLFADLFFMIYPTSTEWGRWLDAGWMVGAALLAAATWTRPAPRPEVKVSEGVGAGRVALAIAPLLVPGLIEVIGYSRGVDPNPLPMFAASVMLAILALIRALRLLRSTERARQELSVAEQHFEALVQRSSDAAIVLDPDGRVRYVSPAVRDQFGYGVDELIGRIGWDLIHPDDLDFAVATFGSVVDVPGGHVSAELRLLDATGEWRWVEEVVTNLIEVPAVRGLVANIRDISTRKAAERELSRMAHFDALTGLANRWLLTQNLGNALTDHPMSTTLLVIDLDQFKFVNDSRGHAVGDELLIAVAERLRATLPNDTIARIGGDEFAAICSDVADVPQAVARAAMVERALEAPIDLHGNGTFTISASIGIAVSKEGTTPIELLQQADTAMYEAKSLGTAQSTVFDVELRQRAEDRLTVQTELRTALRARELIVHYQPVIDLATGKMNGVEALVRWRHPTRGLLMPGAFIPIAEHSDLIDRISAFVLEQACSDAAWWSRSGHPVSVAVNISGAQLRDEDLGPSIQRALYDSQLPPSLLTIEITETALMRGAERAIASVRAVRALGVQVALDDFGTGYSSLSYLKQVPSDIVKIDRSFVTDIAVNAADRAIAGAIIGLAAALGRTVIAEGVETEEQCEVLRGLGCPLAQGYLWSEAVAAEAVLALRGDGARKPLASRSEQ